jgi:type II secretory pathway component PulF
MAQFFRALSLLYIAGVLPAESVRLAAGASGNEALTRDVTGIVPRLENGERLTAALEASGHFSRIVLGVLRTGEDSCTLPDQLDKLADSLEHEAEAALKRRAEWFKR